jgi:beta-barrel assembly-enhancing protease
MYKIKFKYLFIILASLSISCNDNPDDNCVNIFSVNDDIKMGQQARDQIAADPVQFPVIPESANPAAYKYLTKMRDKILNSGKVFYKDKFPWELRIIKNDSVLNAFCVPGGYIYVYTGLIKYLDKENELAGVLGHEMAHADRRHSSDQLTKLYGAQVLLGIIFGKDSSKIAEVATSLIFLKFSRTAEAEADKYSVEYLCPTDYQADGSAGFFEKINNAGTERPPEFLSTHPDPGNRIVAIKSQKTNLGCSGTGTFDSEYQAFKNSL